MHVRFLDAVFRAERNEVDVVASAFQISIRATPLCLLVGLRARVLLGIEEIRSQWSGSYYCSAFISAWLITFRSA